MLILKKIQPRRNRIWREFWIEKLMKDDERNDDVKKRLIDDLKDVQRKRQTEQRDRWLKF
jgi:hypothetical protein